MRLLIVVPEQPEATGNFVTARRLQSGLILLGMDVELFVCKHDDIDAFTAAVEQFRPDHLLLLHAWRSGRLWHEWREWRQRPCFGCRASHLAAADQDAASARC